MVFHIFSYAYNTLLNEIAETSHVIKEIFFFHSHHIFEKIELKRAKKELLKKMKKAKDFTEWKKYAEEYDDLKGIPPIKLS